MDDVKVWMAFKVLHQVKALSPTETRKEKKKMEK